MKSDFTPCLIILIAVIALLFGAWRLDISNEKERQHRQETGYHLPSGATDIIDVGNDWQEFTYRNQRFLHRRKVNSYNGYEAIVKIDGPSIRNQ